MSQGKSYQMADLPEPMSGLEIRRGRGVVDRTTCTITLDPIVLNLLRVASKTTGRRISYLIEDAVVESRSLDALIGSRAEQDLMTAYHAMLALKNSVGTAKEG